MKNFKKYLIEKRSHSDKNPRIPALVQLEKYFNNKNYFISFTTINKLGIKPRSQFNTPMGIYTYPLKPYYDDYKVKKKSGFAITYDLFPYASDRPYIQVIKLKSIKGIVYGLNSYTIKNYDRDVKRLHKLFMSRRKPQLKKLLSLIKKEMKKVYPEGLKSLKMGVPIIIHRNKNFPDNDSPGVLDLKLYIHEYNDKLKYFDYLIKKGEGNNRYSNTFSKLWSLTRIMSQDRVVRELFKDKAKRPMVLWAYLLRSIGYEGFVDSEGTGIIHPHERVQAVFLSMKNIEVVDMILNKDYDRLMDVEKYNKYELYMENNKISVKETSLKNFLDFSPYSNLSYNNEIMRKCLIGEGKISIKNVIYNVVEEKLKGNPIGIIKGKRKIKYTDEIKLASYSSEEKISKHILFSCDVKNTALIKTTLNHCNVYNSLVFSSGMDIVKSSFFNNCIYSFVSSSKSIYKKCKIIPFESGLIKQNFSECEFEDCIIDSSCVFAKSKFKNTDFLSVVRFKFGEIVYSRVKKYSYYNHVKIKNSELPISGSYVNSSIKDCVFKEKPGPGIGVYTECIIKDSVFEKGVVINDGVMMRVNITDVAINENKRLTNCILDECVLKNCVLKDCKINNKNKLEGCELIDCEVKEKGNNIIK